MIFNNYKQYMDYHLVNPQQTVSNWVKAQIDELIKQKMGSGIEVKRNDFKTAVEKFVEQIENVV